MIPTTDDMLAYREERKMGDYKLVPLEPTPEMVEAAEEAHMPFGDMDLAIRMAILDAPVVQGEPVATLNEARCFSLEDANRIMSLAPGTKLYTAPQPAEQQPLKPSLALEAATHLTNWMEMDLCECEGGHSCGYNEVKRTRDALLGSAEQQPELAKYQPSGCVICTCDHEAQCQGCGAHHCGTHPIGQLYKPAYQQPAPDVSELVEALEQGFPLLSDEGLDEVEHHCEWVIQRERKRVHSILAAHRKGEEV